MVRLKNIKLDNNLIEADYFPECEKIKFGHVSLDLNTKERKYTLVGDYGEGYPHFAFRGLEKIIDKLNNHEINELPKERTVMWY